MKACAKFLFFALLLHSSAWAVVIRGQVIVNYPLVYDHTTIKLLNGSFIVTHNGSLTIKHSRIEGTLSPKSSPLFDVAGGTLALDHNTVTINTSNILADPLSAPKYAVINIHGGSTSLISNTFSIDTHYTAALLSAASNKSAITVSENTINYFHGGIMIQNSDGSIINRNTFFRVSCGNIYIKNSQDITASGNTILFSGNNNVGDGFDIIDSDNIRVTGNHVFSGSCYSIFCMRSSHILITDNTVAGGITYAIYATDTLTPNHPGYSYLSISKNPNKNEIPNKINTDIIIKGNYLSQNRYGLSASQVRGLTVKNNFFIQYFKDNLARQFWTNNEILLKNISELSWSDNFYKEAFSQNSLFDNHKTQRFTEFPEHNGVVLP